LETEPHALLLPISLETWLHAHSLQKTSLLLLTHSINSMPYVAASVPSQIAVPLKDA
jgi:CRISPR-associated DxTHG motif protein